MKDEKSQSQERLESTFGKDFVEKLIKTFQIWEEKQQEAVKEIDDFIESPTWKEFQELFPDTQEYISLLGRQAPYSMARILSAVKDRLPDLRQNPAQRPPTFTALAEEVIDQLGMTPESLVQEIVDIFINAKADTPLIQVLRKIDKLDIPLDKVNSKAWNLPESKAGKLLKLAVEKAGTKKEINVLYSIDFAEAVQAGLQISGRLDAYDQRVYTAVSSLYTYQGEYMTAAQIYYAMGYNGTLGKVDKKKINDSLLKMMKAVISIDNTAEARVYKYNKINYKGSLLPLEIITGIVNGEEVDGMVHLLKRPPLYTYAVLHNQLTTIPRDVLVTPLNKTAGNLTLEAYLMERIAREKRKKGQRKILYKTVYTHTGTATQLQRSRMKKKIMQLMDYYISTSFVNGYKTAADGIIIDL